MLINSKQQRWFIPAGITFVMILLGVVIIWQMSIPTSYQPIEEDPHPEIDSLFHVMNQYLRTRQYHEGKQVARQTLNLSRQQAYRYGEVNSLTALGFVYNHQAKFDSAASFLKTARKLVLKYKLDPAMRHRAGAFLAESYRDLGENDKALQCLQDGVNYFRSRDDTLRLCSALNNLGLLYQYQGKYEDARRIFEEGLTYAVKLPEERYYERSFTGNLGILFSEMGQLDRAIPLIEISLRMGKEMNDPTAQAIDLLHLGSINYTRGNYRSAIKQYLEAAALAEEVGETVEIIASYENIARIYDALNDYQSAEHYYRKGISIAETNVDGKHRYFPWIYKLFGDHWQLRGEYSKAETFYQKAMLGFERLESPIDVAKAYVAFAELFYKQGKFEQSIHQSHSALKIFRKLKAAKDNLAQAYLWMGASFSAIGEKDSALVVLTAVLNLIQDSDAAEISWQTHDQLANIYSEREELSRAAEHAQQAVNAIERLRRYTLSPESGSTFLADKSVVYQHYFDILYKIYQQSKNSEIVDKLLFISEQTRSRALSDNLRSGMKNVFYQLKESAGLQNLETQIVSVNRHIREELLKPKKQQRQEMIRSWKQQLASLNRQFDLQVTQFAVTKPQLSALSGVSTRVSITEIQELLTPGSAIFSYFLSLNNVYGFAITTDSAVIRKLDILPPELRENINRLRQPFQRLKQGKIDFIRLRFDADLSHRLYEKLIAPLMKEKRDISHLIIIPDGMLNYLPFEMLVDNVATTGKDGLLFSHYRDHHYLIQDVTISYLPALSIAPLLAKKESHPINKTLLAFGNPFPSQQLRQEVLGNKAAPSGLRALTMTPLPGADLEIKGIAKIYGEEAVEALTGANASEAIYKKKADDYGYLHFATHGYINEDNPSFSALLLYPGNNTEDGFLYTHEIYAYPVNAELVSLSACETALGKLQKGEGLISFVQAFLAAGSRNVMASLWSVEESTYPLMILFYQKLSKGMNIAEALREAKLEFMKGTSTIKTGQEYANAHPFLWAPFVLYTF